MLEHALCPGRGGLTNFMLRGKGRWLSGLADVTHVQRFRSANDVAKSFGSISSQMGPPTVHARLNPMSLTLVLDFWIPLLFLGGCLTLGDKSIVTFPSQRTLENVSVESVRCFLV